VRLCRDVAKERLIVTALNAALAGRSAASSLAPSYWGDGINDHLIKSNLWCPRRRSARGGLRTFAHREANSSIAPPSGHSWVDGSNRRVRKAGLEDAADTLT